jgi:hypothetical protein
MSDPVDPTTKLVILTPAEARKYELEAIRAFVERVERRLPDYDTGRGAEAWLKGYHRAIRDELAAMEKEAE